MQLPDCSYLLLEAPLLPPCFSTVKVDPLYQQTPPWRLLMPARVPRLCRSAASSSPFPREHILYSWKARTLLSVLHRPAPPHTSPTRVFHQFYGRNFPKGLCKCRQTKLPQLPLPAAFAAPQHVTQLAPSAGATSAGWTGLCSAAFALFCS